MLLTMSCISCALIVRSKILIILDVIFGEVGEQHYFMCDVVYFHEEIHSLVASFWGYYQLLMIINSLGVAKYDIIDIFK